jgi:hypothetical protein
MIAPTEFDAKLNSQVETVIRFKLWNLEPSFNFDGIDKIILIMCRTDFSSYIDYLKENHMKLNNRSVIMDKFILPPLENINNLINMTICNEGDYEDFDDDRKFIENWVEWWFNKYKRRVEITFTKPLPSKTLTPENNILSKFNPEEINDIKKIVKFKFIKDGEICGSTILTDALFNRMLSQYSDKIDWTISAKLHLLNAILRETNKLIHVSGTLIFIRPTKDNYSLREYRNDGSINA